MIQRVACGVGCAFSPCVIPPKIRLKFELYASFYIGKLGAAGFGPVKIRPAISPRLQSTWSLHITVLCDPCLHYY